MGGARARPVPARRSAEGRWVARSQDVAVIETLRTLALAAVVHDHALAPTLGRIARRRRSRCRHSPHSQGFAGGPRLEHRAAGPPRMGAARAPPFIESADRLRESLVRGPLRARRRQAMNSRKPMSWGCRRARRINRPGRSARGQYDACRTGRRFPPSAGRQRLAREGHLFPRSPGCRDVPSAQIGCSRRRQRLVGIWRRVGRGAP